MQRSSCALALALALLTLVTPGCREKSPDPNRRLTKAECTTGVDHAIALFDADSAMTAAAKMMRDTRESAITQCTNVGTLRDHDCLVKSKTAYELGLCPMPGTR